MRPDESVPNAPKQESSPTRALSWSQAGAVMIPIAVVLLYAVALDAPFVFDDRIHILEQTAVINFDGDRASYRALVEGDFGWSGRPLLNLTYALNYSTSGTEPTLYRAVNLLIHILNSLLVAIAAGLLAAFGGLRNRAQSVGVIAGLLFASHPLLIESVTYVSGRSSSLCATFYFAGLVTAIWAGSLHGKFRAGALAMTAVCTGLAWTVKQDAVTLPFAALAIVWMAWPENVTRPARFRASAILAVPIVLLLVMQFQSVLTVASSVQDNDALVAAGFEPTLPYTSYVFTAVEQSYNRKWCLRD